MRCQNNVQRTLAMGPALVPAIGYDKAVKIVKAAAESGHTVREATLDGLLDPARQAGLVGEG